MANIEILRIQPSPTEPGTLLDSLDGPTALFLLTSTCPYCARSVPQFGALRDGLSAVSVGFLPVSLDARAPEVAATPPGLELWAPSSSAEARRLAIRSVPTILLIGSDGTVLGVWSGEITPDRVAAIIADVRELRETAARGR